jgi:hypothetical protein
MKKGTKVAVIGRGPGTIVDIFDEQHQYAVKLANGKIEFVPFTFVQSMKDRSSDTKKIQEMANIKPKLIVDVNHNPTKKGIKVQFALPQTLSGDAKAEATQKLQSKLNQGLEQYNLTVSQDTDVPYSNVIGFLIPIADIKLLIKNAIGGGAQAEPAPEEAPAPEEPMKEIKRMKKLAGILKENQTPDFTAGDQIIHYFDTISAFKQYRDEDAAYDDIYYRIPMDVISKQLGWTQEDIAKINSNLEPYAGSINWDDNELLVFGGA